MKERRDDARVHVARARGSLPRVRLLDRFFSRNLARERKVPLFRPLLPTSTSVTALLTRAPERDTELLRNAGTCSRAWIRGQRIDEQFEADASMLRGHF